MGANENDREGSAVPGLIQDRARDLLTKHGVTQKQLGKRLGLSQSGVSQMLNRPGGLTVTEMMAIETVCGAEHGTILERAGVHLVDGTVTTTLADATASATGTVGSPPVAATAAPTHPQLFDVLYEMGLSDRQVRLITQLVMEMRGEER
jgi:hypothetical protein